MCNVLIELRKEAFCRIKTPLDDGYVIIYRSCVLTATRKNRSEM